MSGGLALAVLEIGGARAFANHQFGRNRKFRRIVSETLKPLQKDASRAGTHFAQGLADGGKARSVIIGELDVVETDDGDILGNAEVGVAKSANGADCGHIIEGNDGGKDTAALQEGLHNGITKFGRRDVAFQLDGELRHYGNAKLLGDSYIVFPTGEGVRAKWLAAHEGNVTMTELVEMAEDEFRGAAMVEENVGNTFEVFMPGDGHSGKAKLVLESGIDEDQALGASTLEETGILVDEVRLVAMMGAEIKVAFLHEEVADTAHDHGVIAIVEFGDEHTHGERALLA